MLMGMHQVCFENSPGNQFHGEKIRGNCFDSKNSMETNVDDFKTIKLSLSMKVPEVYSTGIDSMKTAFIKGETRTNTISLTGTPDDPISYKCNARKLVFFEKKSTSFIHRQPSEVFVNDQKALKIDIIWKEPNSQSTLEKRSWKNLCW